MLIADLLERTKNQAVQLVESAKQDRRYLEYLGTPEGPDEVFIGCLPPALIALHYIFYQEGKKAEVLRELLLMTTKELVENGLGVEEIIKKTEGSQREIDFVLEELGIISKIFWFEVTRAFPGTLDKGIGGIRIGNGWRIIAYRERGEPPKGSGVAIPLIVVQRTVLPTHFNN